MGPLGVALKASFLSDDLLTSHKALQSPTSYSFLPPERLNPKSFTELSSVWISMRFQSKTKTWLSLLTIEEMLERIENWAEWEIRAGLMVDSKEPQKLTAGKNVKHEDPLGK